MGRARCRGRPGADVRGVALVPGTGEYSLATEPVYYRRGNGENPVLNVHNDRGLPDIEGITRAA